jgi:CspA family cold shock protein
LIGLRRGRASQGRTRCATMELRMPNGTVKWFNPAKGYGFIEPDEGDKDTFVHVSAVTEAGLSTLEPGQKLSYEIREEERGRQSAVDLHLLD